MVRRSRQQVGGVRAFPVVLITPSQVGNNGMHGIPVPARNWSTADGTATSWRLEISALEEGTECVSGNRHSRTYNSGWIPGTTTPTLAAIYSTKPNPVLVQWFVRFR
jgi:hypothetical protein